MAYSKQLLMIPVLLTLCSSSALANPCQKFQDKQNAVSRKNDYLFEKYEAIAVEVSTGTASKQNVCMVINQINKMRLDALDNDKKLVKCVCDYDPGQCKATTDLAIKNRKQLAGMLDYEKSHCSIGR